MSGTVCDQEIFNPITSIFEFINEYSIRTWIGATENAGVEITGVDRRVENAGVEKAGADSRSGKCRSKSYGTPNRDYFERI